MHDQYDDGQSRETQYEHDLDALLAGEDLLPSEAVDGETARLAAALAEAYRADAPDDAALAGIQARLWPQIVFMIHLQGDAPDATPCDALDDPLARPPVAASRARTGLAERWTRALQSMVNACHARWMLGFTARALSGATLGLLLACVLLLTLSHVPGGDDPGAPYPQQTVAMRAGRPDVFDRLVTRRATYYYAAQSMRSGIHPGTTPAGFPVRLVSDAIPDEALESRWMSDLRPVPQ